MNDWKTELLTELLDCGYGDLGILEDCEYDFCDVIQECKDCEMELTVNNLCWAMFQLALADFEQSINERIEKLHEELEDGIDAIPVHEELEALESLDVREDIETYHNYIDTHVWFRNNEEIYRRYLSSAMDDFEDHTGFCIG